MIHALKIEPPYFDQVFDGEKPFEVRKNDRNFETGDRLLLQEYIPESGYTGREMFAVIAKIYTTKDRFFEFLGDLCILVIREDYC